MHTKVLSKYQIVLKFLALKSCACLWELPGTVFGGFDIPINGAAWSTNVWNEGKGFVILIVIFSVLVQ